MRLLGYAQVDIRSRSRLVENGGIRAVGERISITGAGDRGPELAGNVGGILRDEKPGSIGAGRGHDNVRSDLDLKNCIGRGRWADGCAEVDFPAEPVDAAKVIQLGRKA